MAHVADHLSVGELEERYRTCIERLLGTTLSDDLAAGAGPYDRGNGGDDVLCAALDRGAIARYNAIGPQALGDLRRNNGAPPLNTAAKVAIAHVPYRGAAPALNDLLGGQIPLIWASPVAVMSYVEQGNVRMLGVSTQQRDPALPQVPTISESGVPGFDATNWFGIVAPVKVPAEVVACVGQALREVTDLPDVRGRMSTLGFNLDFRDRDHFRELIIRDHQKYGTIIREAGIQPE